MKTLSLFIQNLKAFNNPNEYVGTIDININGFIFKKSFKYSNVEFDVFCTKYALNWLRLNFGYLPETNKSNIIGKNDCNILLHYSLPLTDTLIEKLEFLNNGNHVRHNCLNAISLFSASIQLEAFTSNICKIKKQAKWQIYYECQKTYEDKRGKFKANAKKLGINLSDNSLLRFPLFAKYYSKTHH